MEQLVCCSMSKGGGEKHELHRIEYCSFPQRIQTHWGQNGACHFVNVIGTNLEYFCENVKITTEGIKVLAQLFSCINTVKHNLNPYCLN